MNTHVGRMKKLISLLLNLPGPNTFIRLQNGILLTNYPIRKPTNNFSMILFFPNPPD